MKDIRFVVHTDENLTGHNLLVTRKQHPRGNDYAVFADKLTEEFGTTITAIYEVAETVAEPHTYVENPTIEPLFETAPHRRVRDAAKAEQNAAYGRRSHLMSAAHARQQLVSAMESHVAAVEWKLNDLKQMVERAKAIDLIDPSGQSNEPSRFVSEASHSRGDSDLWSVTNYALELAREATHCIDIVAAAVRRDLLKNGACCDDPYFAIKGDPERSYSMPSVVCVRCGHVIADDLL